MPNPASRFTGTYRILQPGDAGPPVPPEQKGVRYLASRLQSYGEAELELTVTDGQANTSRVGGRLRATPSQSFDVQGSMTTGPPARAAGRLVGNKGRTADFTAVFADDRLTFSLAYHTDDGALVRAQSFVFERRAPVVAPPPPNPDAALIDQWTARLRRSRFTSSENTSDGDYSGGGYYEEIHRELNLYPDGRFQLDERGFARVSAGGLLSRTPIARSRTGQWSVTAAGAAARLMLTSEAWNESFVLSGSGPAMSLDGRWQGVSLV